MMRSSFEPSVRKVLFIQERNIGHRFVPVGFETTEIVHSDFIAISIWQSLFFGLIMGNNRPQLLSGRSPEITSSPKAELWVPLPCPVVPINPITMSKILMRHLLTLSLCLKLNMWRMIFL